MKFDIVSHLIGVGVGVVGSAAIQAAYTKIKAKISAYIQAEAAKLAAVAKKV